MSTLPSPATDHQDPDEPPERHGDPAAALCAAVAHAGHYLPAQAPMEVFVHHNTLHAFQALPFHDALAAAEEKLGVRGYFPEARYREALAAGRISDADLDAVLRTLPPPPAWPAGLPEPLELRRALFALGLSETSPADRRWQREEAGALRRFRPDAPPAARRRILAETGGSEADELGALWQTCLALCRLVPPPPSATTPPPRWPRELLLRIGDEDPNDLVHPVLIPFCAAFLDRGQSRWSMPDRDQGFFLATCRVLTSGYAVRSAWLSQLGQRLRRALHEHHDATATVLDCLGELGVVSAQQRGARSIDHGQLDDFIEHTLLQLPGWAGMFQRLADAPGPTGRSHARTTLMDFLAVRLTLDVLAFRDVATRLGFHGPLRDLRAFCLAQPPLATPPPPSTEDQAWTLFNVAQLAGLSAARLRALPIDGVAALLREAAALSPRARLRLWHEAYERHYREELLSALAASPAPTPRQATPRFQIITCMDDRSESLRRHFEEQSPTHHTLGAAGFFNLAIAYQGIDDPSTFPLCPVVVAPQHQIVEEPIAADADRAAARLRRRRRLGRLESLFVRASRSLLWGPVLTALSGFVAALPLLAVVFAPWWTARLRRAVSRYFFPEVRTQLTPDRSSQPAHDGDGELLLGFVIEEKAARVGGLLENLGLRRREDFAPIVALIGHDSSSVNNPHFAAYSCGACGGRSGGPNARLFARMANRPAVRAALRARGIDIPDETVFIGAVHDTCRDAFTLFDTDHLPEAAQAEIRALLAALEEARQRNAHERCRRFASAPADLPLGAALRHVETRGSDLSQARPELGHATNAACVVGRRALTRGLFLDRRVFLVSYDPSTDPDGSVLERILQAVGPVGAGINLEYFFSSVDNDRLGAGTKLPYNVTALLGVMNGAGSDLRTGLPRQMIEIHEPVRLHMVLETTEDIVAGILRRQPGVRELCDNGWVRVIVLHRDTRALSIYEPGVGFSPWTPPPLVLPVVTRSVDWYRGKRGFVPPARVTAGVAGEAA